MSGCEKCWSDSASMDGDSHTEAYHRLLAARVRTPCTLKEQCGELHVLMGCGDGSRRCVCGKMVDRVVS